MKRFLWGGFTVIFFTDCFMAKTTKMTNKLIMAWILFKALCYDCLCKEKGENLWICPKPTKVSKMARSRKQLCWEFALFSRFWSHNTIKGQELQKNTQNQDSIIIHRDPALSKCCAIVDFSPFFGPKGAPFLLSLFYKNVVGS